MFLSAHRFGFTACNLTVSVVSRRSHQASWKKLLCCLSSIKWQRDKVSGLLVNTVEHLGLKELHVLLRSCWRAKQS